MTRDSAAAFRLLLAQFRDAWDRHGRDRFALHFVQRGDWLVLDKKAVEQIARRWRKSQPDNLLWRPPFDEAKCAMIAKLCGPPFDKRTHELIALVHLPMKCTGDGAGENAQEQAFTLDGFMVADKREGNAAAISAFKRLCRKAGASLPLVFRDRLRNGYCQWDCSQPESWWIALLAYSSDLTIIQNIQDGQSSVSPAGAIYNPWRLSIDLIEELKLNTEAPRWTGESDQSRSEPVAASNHVELFGPAKTPWIDHKEKSPLTKARYDVVLKLVNAGAKGLTKDMLESEHGGARAILRALADSDPDWTRVIQFPGKTGRRYRIE